MIRLVKIAYAFVIFALLMVCGIIFIDFLRAPSVSTTNKPSQSYIISSTKSVGDGKIEKMLAYQTNYQNIGVDNEYKKQVHDLLVEKIKTVAEVEKNSLLNKYNSQPDDFEVIILNTNDVAGYVTRFSSLDTYNFYYNSIQREVKKGSFVNVMTQKMQYPLTTEEVENYKNLMIDAVSSIINEDVSSKYVPIVYYEYVSPNSHGKANANQIQQDSLGFTHYIWLNNAANQAKELVIKINIINYWLWIVVGLFLPLSIMCVAIAILSFKKDLSKKGLKNQ